MIEYAVIMIPADSITPMAQMEQAAECLRTLSHPIRLRMVEVLLDHRLTVGQIAELCAIRPNVASEHLRKMKDRGLLDLEKEGRQVFYTIAEPGLRSIMNCVQTKFGRVEG